MLLNLDAISKIEDIKTEIVDMREEWGGDIKIKALNFSQQIEFENKKSSTQDDSDLILLLLQMCVVNENDEPMFDDESIKMLKNKNSQSLLKLFTACLNINSLDEKGVENKAKN